MFCIKQISRKKFLRTSYWFVAGKLIEQLIKTYLTHMAINYAMVREISICGISSRTFYFGVEIL